MLFHQSAAQAMKKRVTVTHFTLRIIRTYRYINCIERTLFVKRYPIVGIHRLLRSSCCFLNTDTAIMWQLIRTARTLEAECWQVCGEAWGTGTKEGEPSTERVWAAAFHHVTARSRLARVLKLHSFIQ